MQTLAAAGVLAIGALVLVGGWMLGIEPLKNWAPDVATMKANTAIAFLLCGVSLWCRRIETPARRRIAQAAAAAATLLAGATLAQYIGGWNIGIDELLFLDPDPRYTLFPGRMPLATAAAFLLLGAALMLLDRPAAEPLVGLALVLPVVSLIVLTYGADELTAPFSSNAMALPTALAFVLLGVGVLSARPQRGVARLVASRGPEGVLARRTLLGAVAVIAAVGALAQLGHLAGLYGADTRGALDFAGTLLGMVALLLWGTATAARIDAERRRGLDAVQRSEERLRDANAELARALDEQRRAEAALREQTALLRAITDNSSDPIFAKDHDSRMLLANPAALGLIGKPAHEVLGRSDDEWAPDPEQGRRLVEIDREIMAGGRARIVDEHFGDRVYQSMKAPLRDADGRISGTFGIARDVTETRRALEAARLSEERAQQAVSVARLGLFEVDLRSGEPYWSPRMREIIGWGDDEPPSRQDYRALIPAAQREAFVAAVRRSEQPDSDGLYEVEHPLLRRDGQLRWLSVRGQVTFEGTGPERRPLRTIGAMADITERKAAEEALRASEQRLRLFLESAPAALAIFDRTMRYLAVSRRWLHDYHLTADVIGRSHYEVFPELPERWKNVHRRALAGEDFKADSDRFERADGTIQWLKWEIQPWHMATGEIGGIMIATEDITEHKRAEERFRQVVEGAPNAMVMVDRDGRITLVNAETERLFGYRRDELLGRSLEMLVPQRARAGHPAHRAGYTSAPSKRAMGFGRDLHGLRKDGAEVPVEIGLNPIETGEGTFVLAAIVDITERERLQDELRAANAELERRVEQRTRELAEKALQLERVSRVKSEFLANMSHELRTPLNGVLILSQLLAENADGNLSERQVMYARTVHSAGNDLLLLIDDILDLAKVEAGKVELDLAPVDLVALGDEIERAFRPLADNKRLEFEIALHASLAPRSIETDPRRLRQIVKNLLSNAIKFTDRGGVRLEVAPASGGWPGGHAVLDRAPRIVALSVNDSGIGIAPDKQSIIFDAFRQAEGSTSRKYGGSGLGLAISRELAQLLGGALTVQSTPDVGSRFTLWLPAVYGGPHVPVADADNASAIARAETLAGTPAAVSAVAPLAEQPAPVFADDDRDAVLPGDRVLLVVEDDARFASIVVEAARSHGFKAVATPSGEQALALARELRPAAITLDLLLPDISGWTVLERLHADEATRGIPVEVISIVAESERALASGATGCHGKPISADRLASVCRTLDAAAGPRPPRRLLIVDDDPAERDALVAWIGGADIEIKLAASGEEALQVLGAGRYDCVVLDLKLPGIGGEEVLHLMRDDTALRDVPVVVYTGAELGAADESRLRALGGLVIVKGARSPQQLLAATARFLHRVSAELAPQQRQAIESIDGDIDGRALAGKTVLLVDDEVRNLFALTGLLEQQGIAVVVAESGLEALERLAANRGIDLVLMDIMMPGMDGYQAMRAIRADARHAELPVIALTAKAMKGDREKCLAAGASDYLSKPVEPARLRLLLRAWLCR